MILGGMYLATVKIITQNEWQCIDEVDKSSRQVVTMSQSKFHAREAATPPIPKECSPSIKRLLETYLNDSENVF